MERIRTFKQHMNRKHRAVCEEYGIRMSEVRALYPEHAYRGEWWGYVLEAFEDGCDFTPAAASRLNAPQLRDLSRTTRGLRDGLPEMYLMAGQRLALKAAA